MARYSYSKLSTYENCPLQYKFKYIEKRPEVSSPEARRGSEVHDCIAEYVKHLVGHGLQTDLDFIRNLGVSAEAREILETFATTHLFPPGNQLAEWKAVSLLGDRQVEYSGVMDFIEGRGLSVDVSDYKTFFRALSQKEVEESLQLKGYVRIAADVFPEAGEFCCVMDFVRLGVTRQVVYARDDLPEIEADLLRRIEQIESDETFEARPGGTCSWCPGIKDCPALASGIEAITCSEDAEALADELIVLKARDKEIQGLLKPYVTREGPVARNGMEVGYSTASSVGYELEDARPIFEAHDYQDNQYLRVDTTAVKKLAAKDKDLAAALEAVAIDKSVSKFGIRKGGDASCESTR